MSKKVRATPRFERGYCWWWLLLLLVHPTGLAAQNALAAYTVEVRAEALAASGGIRLSWKPDAQATYYDVYRWNKGGSISTSVQLLQTTTGTAALSGYVDATAVPGRAYEYRVRKDTPSSTTAVGYVLAGVEIPPAERRGTVVLVVDSTHAAFLAPDLAQLQADLRGDGWLVVRHDVAPTRPPAQVKSLIRAAYQADPTEVRAVFLLGHVAVPYAGDINPDGHPDHRGAWPADGYYGDMTGTWTDTNINNPNASRPANRNVPGDGKFDQSSLPNTLQLEVGRVDLSELPAFGLPERELLRRYLRKDHQFRHGAWAVPERGLIDDQFGLSTGEPLANNGWRNFAPLFGLDAGAVTPAGYFGTLRTDAYLWAYSCGPGTYGSMGGVGSTADFASGPVRSVFNMHFGSYFGDWDNPDNYLRAALAADGYTLTNCWAGRPDWFVHFMGLGETVGYCARRSQVFNGFTQSFGSGLVHTALLGDPTLRLHPVLPPGSLTVTPAAGGAVLAWAPSPEAGASYYVYRAATPAGPFYRLSGQPLTTTTFQDPAPLAGTSCYLVRTLKLQTGASGSYYNLSQGVFGPFTAPAPPASGGTWLGLSADWHSPGNWSSGVVPSGAGPAVVPAGTPFAPVVGQRAEVGSLTLGSQARLTVAAGGRLLVRQQLRVEPGSGPAPTTLTLATAQGASPAGQLELLDYTSPTTGLQLPAGAALDLGAGARLRLLGSLDAGAATLRLDALSQLVFDHDSTMFTPFRHELSGASALTVGVLRVGDSRETLELNAAVEVLSQVENRGAIVTNGRLLLRAGPGRQAQLAPVPPGPGQPLSLGRYTGNVGVQVYVDGSRNAGAGYRHLAPPVTGLTVRALTTSTFTPVVNPQYNTVGTTAVPFPTVFTYNQGRVGSTFYPGPLGFDQGWVSPGALTTRLTSAQGLTVNMPANATLSFSGPPVTAPVNVTGLSRDSIPAGGWYLLGNPYAAPLHWDHLTADSARFGQLNPTLYVFKSSGQYAGSYACYLPGVGGMPGIGTNGGGAVVPVAQAFFVRTDSAEHLGYLRFTIDDLLTQPAAPSVQRSTDPRSRLVLTLRPASGISTSTQQAAIYFQTGATAGPDRRYDAPYLTGAGQPLLLASETAGQALSINGLPPLTGADVLVPLRLQAATTGPYQLAAETLANLPAGYRAYLRDSVAGTFTDLATAQAAVPVALTAGRLLRGRYAVLFTARVLATAPPMLTRLVSLFPNPARTTTTLHVPAALRAGQPLAPVVVYDALGRAVRTLVPQSVGADNFELSVVGLAPGMYTVRVATARGTVSRPLVVE